ncbi:MAG: RlmE family RNA methyltransferase [Alphaproteobacteria bacterium]|nr:RlmE family RNA methyltransferase [Alphaproteobacteria bacterium]
MSRARGGRPGGRGTTVRVRTARGRKASSTRWLQRQLNDPYVAEAKKRGYRSRAAFKLIQIDEKFHLLRPGATVLDLGAAPGGWSQVAAERAGSGHVVAADSQAMEPIAGVTVLRLDIFDADAETRLRDALPDGADLVLSDMAPAATGHPDTDHLRIVALVEAAFAVAEGLLKPDGAFVAKVLQGGTEGELLATLKRRFRSVKHIKPAASRQDSREMYVVAQGFREG